MVMKTAEPLVRFQPYGRKVESEKGRSLLQHSRDAGVALESICNAAGKCGKCKVTVKSGSSALSEPTSSELESLTSQELRSGTRLACQALLVGRANVIVDIPEESQRGHHRLLAAGTEPTVKLDPAVKKIVLRIPPATLKDLRADDDRLLDVIYTRARVRSRLSPGVHRALPDALREKGWTTTVTLYRNEEVIRLDAGDTSKELYGIAIDIGTTKVVGYLLDLRSEGIVSTESIPNPQIPYGEDLMSRISYASKNENGLEVLQKAVVDGVDTIISRLCASARIEPDDILEVMVVGNTAMHHIFFGIPATHLAKAPYAPAVRTPISVSPAHLGVNTYPFGRVTSLPNIAGFVGADAVADLIASGLHDDMKIGMMIDIGTNTEIIAGNKDRLICCSCASGPAFEGAHIKFGMRASTGAVERVWIDPSSDEVVLRTIDDAAPRGICGSGIVDAVSEMFKTGVLDASGRIIVSPKNRRTRRSHDGPGEYLLAKASETSSGKDLTITQHDVQEIQLAKAAIFTGVSILMRKLKLECSQLSRVYAAGAFGTYVDASSAIAIGMYPDVPVDRIRFIGNAAGSGARMCLRSTKVRDMADTLSREVEYVELAAEKDFQNEFAQAMFLPHRDLDRFPSHGVRRGPA